MRVLAVALGIATLTVLPSAWAECPLPPGSYTGSCEICWVGASSPSNCIDGLLCCNGCETGFVFRGIRDKQYSCINTWQCPTRTFRNDHGRLECAG
jgi:hypothetical protein